MIAVAFIVTDGDLKKRSDSATYYMQIIDLKTGSHIGTIQLPIECTKGEALTAIVDASVLNQAKTAVTLIIKTPDNYRMDTYSVEL